MSNINSHFSSEVIELVVSASVFNPALLPDDETFLRAYGNYKPKTLAQFYRENAGVIFEGITYSSLAIINKENCLENGKFLRELFSMRRKL